MMGGYSFNKISYLNHYDARVMINAVCERQALRLDTQLLQAEEAGQTIRDYVVDRIDNLDALAEKEDRKAYLKDFEELSFNIVKMVEGAKSIYLHLDPSVAGPAEGFYLIYDNNINKFKNVGVTDLSRYDEFDYDKVGWFYVPKYAGKPIWMSPYHNMELDMEIISYVVPIYVDYQFIGMIGIDIDFSTFVTMAQDAAVYENGYANIIDMKTKAIYFRYPSDDKTIVRRDDITDVLYNLLLFDDNNGDELINLPSAGVDYSMSFQRLRNGMRYIVCSPESEITKESKGVLLRIILFTALWLTNFVVATILIVRRIIKPLTSLAEATKKIAAGDWDVDIQCNTKDEISVLATSIQAMAEKLSEYVDAVKQMAFKDSLTGVKNKTFYQKYVDDITAQEGDSSSTMEYAIVMFDVNNLKLINDNYGHEAGDVLLLEASRYICKVYAHSPVFRIGGDEFAAILRGEDYRNRNELIKSFEEKMKDLTLGVEPHSKIEIAFGMAERSSSLASYEEVFKMADDAMYDKKREMKA
ncbi:MAG: diguanylate cyclase [Pseudobutyrivibrio sp.]|nr:diguanylate cyclase [Pseudobutyrivibrio sp.]